jgi:hypothetical protein
MYRFVGKHAPELIAVVSSSVVVLAGAYLSWFYDPLWLNRAGALVIIAGVLLAASRFHEWVQQKLGAFLEAHYDSIAEEALRSTRQDATPLSEEDRRKVKARLKAKVQDDLTVVIEAHKRRIRAWEVLLVVVGTFLNGFGEYLVSMLKSNGT